MAGRVGVVAVPLADRRSVSVGVHLVGRHDPVAVVVQAVAGLRGAGERGGLDRIAVAAAVEAGGAADHERGAGQPAVAVVVHLVGGHDPVAVVVERVAQLDEAETDHVRGVVAVAVAQPLAVGVGVGLVRRRGAVAVVVLAVAELGGAGEDQRIAVVAVGARGDAVAVVVQALVVRGAVAVLVDAVAQLLRAGVHGRLAVVAVALADPRTVAVGVHLVGRHRAVAVVVQAVAQLGVAGVGRGLGVIAVGVADPVAVRVGVDLFVRHRAVAVVVQAVAQLGGAGEDRGIGVVAVGAGGDAVAVLVEPLVVGGAVAVLVDAVAQLLGAGVDARVVVVAVGVGGVAVAVAVAVADRDRGAGRGTLEVAGEGHDGHGPQLARAGLHGLDGGLVERVLGDVVGRPGPAVAVGLLDGRGRDHRRQPVVLVGRVGLDRHHQARQVGLGVGRGGGLRRGGGLGIRFGDLRAADQQNDQAEGRHLEQQAAHGDLGGVGRGRFIALISSRPGSPGARRGRGTRCRWGRCPRPRSRCPRGTGSARCPSSTGS